MLSRRTTVAGQCSRRRSRAMAISLPRLHDATPSVAASWSYAETYVAEDDVLAAARERAAEVGVVPIGPGGGAALRFLASVLDARAVVEIGTGTGVSGLWLLRGMRPDGVLTTVDIEAEHQRLARETFTEAGIPTQRARTIAGAALDVLPRLTDAHYDIVFVDGDKTEYAAYLARGPAPAASRWRAWPSTTPCGTTRSPTRSSATRRPSRCASCCARSPSTTTSSRCCCPSATGCCWPRRQLGARGLKPPGPGDRTTRTLAPVAALAASAAVSWRRAARRRSAPNHSPGGRQVL